MGFRLIPKMRHRRRMLLRSAIYNTRIYPCVVDGAPTVPAFLDDKQKVGFIMTVSPMTRPIDPVGRMDEASLKAFRAAAFDEREVA